VAALTQSFTGQALGECNQGWGVFPLRCFASFSSSIAMQRRAKLEPAQACHLAAGIVGTAWKAHRRHLPSDCKDLMAELLLGLRAHIFTDLPSSRYDLRNVTSLLKSLATVLLVHDAAPLSLQPSLLSPLQRSPAPKKMVTFGATVIQELSPLQCVRSDEVQGHEVTALKKDIRDLQTKVQRMSDSRRSDESCLKVKLQDVSQLLVEPSRKQQQSGAGHFCIPLSVSSASMTFGLPD